MAACGHAPHVRPEGSTKSQRCSLPRNRLRLSNLSEFKTGELQLLTTLYQYTSIYTLEIQKFGQAVEGGSLSHYVLYLVLASMGRLYIYIQKLNQMYVDIPYMDVYIYIYIYGWYGHEFVYSQALLILVEFYFGIFFRMFFFWVLAIQEEWSPLWKRWRFGWRWIINALVVLVVKEVMRNLPKKSI